MYIKNGTLFFKKEDVYYLACFDLSKSVSLIGVRGNELVETKAVFYAVLNSDYEQVTVSEMPKETQDIFKNIVESFKVVDVFDVNDSLSECNSETVEFLGKDFYETSIFSPYNKRKDSYAVNSNLPTTMVIIRDKEELELRTTDKENNKVLIYLYNLRTKTSLIISSNYLKSQETLSKEDIKDSIMVYASKAEIKTMKAYTDRKEGKTIVL